MKHTYLQVTDHGVVLKTNKSTSMQDINAFVHKKSAWILKHLKNFEEKRVEKELNTSPQVYYLGTAYELKIIGNQNLKKAKITFKDSKFLIEAKEELSKEETTLLLNNFYKKEAIEKITPLIEHWSKEMNLYPTHVGYRKAKTRWGSCSGKDSISFNYYLLKLPLSSIEYVVVHELAHIQHKNHSSSFWNLVRQHLVDYKVRRDEMRVLERAFKFSE
jgi:predicted metal-dependent hydrolase